MLFKRKYQPSGIFQMGAIHTYKFNYITETCNGRPGGGSLPKGSCPSATRLSSMTAFIHEAEVVDAKAANRGGGPIWASRY